jgi:hypothetical protein
MRIDPRQILRRSLTMLGNARCPECGRAFDPVGEAETYLPRREPLHCSWCGERAELVREYAAWLRQDAAVQRRR